MKPLKIKLLIIFLFTVTAFSQVQQEWVQRYNGTGNSNDFGNAITFDVFGNIIVAGASSGSNERDYQIIKYNSNGILQWSKNYNGPRNLDDLALAVESDDLGNVYVTGRSRGIGTGDDYATIKYSPEGIEQWVQRYNAGTGDDIAEKLILDDSGNVYVTGESQVSLGGSYDIATIKYNSSGVLQWVKRYDRSGGDDFGWDIALDQNNNVCVTGFASDIITGADIVTLKYDNLGNQQWVSIYSGETDNSDEARSIAIDTLNNIYVTGYSWGNGTGPNYITIKYDPTGNEQWVRMYNGIGNSWDWATSIATDNFNNVYISGFISVLNPLSSDIATIKYNSSGVEQWVKTYNGPGNGNDFANSLNLDNLGNIYVAGSSYDSASLSDFVTIQYNPEGTQQWVQVYNGLRDSTDQAFSIAVDNEYNVFVTGTSVGVGSLNDIVTIKYSQVIGLVPISNIVPEKFFLQQNYPNPFNPQTNINFELPVSGEVDLIVYDMLGRKIETLVSQVLNAGTYKVEWDASKYSSGVYYYTISTERFNETKKMILIR